MVGSLANFLLLLLYTGSFPERVAWVLWMFTMGTVALARLAIEQTRAYAWRYAAALGLAGFVVMFRFFGSPVFSIFILALIAYLSDRIVQDCTIVDDRLDASGQGLMDTVAERHRRRAPATDQSANHNQRQKTHRRHQPGRSVLMLSLAALPLFGIGQFMLRDDGRADGFARILLTIYLFASLSLLVTTSFLGLRRYLRQRQTEMPGNVSTAWISGGLLMVAAILFAAYLLPLPGRAIASFELPFQLDRGGESSASRFGWGDEGAEQGTAEDAQAPQREPDSDQDASSVRSERGAESGAAAAGQREQGRAGSESGDEPSSASGSESGSNQGDSSTQAGEPSSSDSNAQSQSSPDQQSGSQNETNSQSGANESSSQSQREQTQGEQSQGERSQGERSQSAQSQSKQSAGEPSQAEQSEGEKSEGEQTESEQSTEQESTAASQSQQHDAADTRAQPERNGSSPLRQMFGTLANLLRLLFILVLLVIVVLFVIIYRAQIAAWWADLFGRGSRPLAATEPRRSVANDGPPPRSFASFRNPIGHERDPRRVVVITFQAFEAWAREQGWQRSNDETPLEFVRRISRELPSWSNAANQIVDAYNRVVYGKEAATQADLIAAAEVWSSMR